MVCAAARDRVRASQAAARAFCLAVTARAVAVHADGRPLQAALTFQAEAADVLRAFLPWHALLESLVAAAGAPPPKAADIGGRYSPGLLRLDGHGAPFEDIG